MRFGKLDIVLQEMLPQYEMIEVVIQAKEGRFDQVYGLVKAQLSRFDLLRRFRAPHLIFEALPNFGMVYATLPAGVIEELAQDPNIEHIWPSEETTPDAHQLKAPKLSEGGYPFIPEKAHFGKGGPFIANSTSFYAGMYCMGTQIAYNKGFYGSGISVGIIDTGVDLQCRSFEGADIGYVTPPGLSETNDSYQIGGGHGTCTAAAIVGQTHWVQEMDDPKQPYRFYMRGTAPRCSLASVRVYDEGGGGKTPRLQRALDALIYANVDIISISAGKSQIHEARNRLNKYARFHKECRAKKVIWVNSAGNEGEPRSINDQADSKDVLAVGAYRCVPGQYYWSTSRGPGNSGLIKPDCLGPTEYYTAGSVSKDCVIRYGATSGATPMVAGTIALARELWRTYLNEKLTTREILDILETYGHKKDNDNGFGPLYFQMFYDWLETEHGVRL